MLFNTIPVLFVDGEQIAHSRAALRFLARELKRGGGSSLNDAKMDMWIEVFVESFMKMPFMEKDKQIKVRSEVLALEFVLQRCKITTIIFTLF